MQYSRAHFITWTLFATMLLSSCGGGSSNETATPRYTVSGTVTGLSSGSAVTIQNNGVESVTVSSNSQFTFPTALAAGSTYAVTISSQPIDQNCIVSFGSGTVAAGNVTNVVVQCPYVRTLYSFGSITDDGSGPESGVVLGSDGNLYGATATGGANWINTINNLGAGTFFRLTPTGAETVLWNFGSAQDGENPSGDLVMDESGNFYGTTYAGGLNGAGTVFKITPNGQETVLWNFGAGNDGRNPFGNLFFGQDGSLYGTASAGGAQGFGAVFRVTLAGGETVLWSFGAGADGRTPKGRLLQASDGNFYGTTESGGDFGFGAVFKLTPSGTETVLYSFASGADGQGPEGLTQGPDGNLYGITIGGGAYSAGTAFKVTLGGGVTILWSFGDGSDGRNPNAAPLLGADGNFYGVTGNGGVNGLGTLYRLTPTGSETVLWSFAGTDGSTPFSTLTQGPDGAIYGTTYRGGTGSAGYGGTVFKLTM